MPNIHKYSQIGVRNILTSNSLTKQIIFMPFYVLINRAPFDIEVQEDKRPADSSILVKTNDCAPLWPRAERDRMLRAKAVDQEQITASFKYDDALCTMLELKNKYGGINVDVHITEGVIYITFTNYEKGMAPALIMNCTDEQISFWEKGNVNVRTLKAKQMIYFTWIDPAGERTLTWKNLGKSNVENDLRSDGVDEFINCSDESEMLTLPSEIRRGSSQNNKVYWVSFLDGTQRVLMFTKNPSVAGGTQSSSRLDQVCRYLYRNH